MESKVYSTREQDCCKALIYQVFMLDTWDMNSIVKCWTFIGDEAQDIWSLAIKQILTEITEMSGQTITDDMWENMERKYDRGEKITFRGFEFKIMCQGQPEYIESF